MRIAQLVSNIHPVSPLSNQAIYSHVGTLTDKLVDRGHEAHLYAASDSVTQGTLHGIINATKNMPLAEDIRRYYMQTLIANCYTNANNLDIIHSHFTLLSSFCASLSDTPTVTSIHSQIRPEIMPFLKEFKNQRYISFSLAQRKQMPELNWIANIYHGIDLQTFAYQPEPGSYLLYLGRITEEKGVHFAIEAAQAAKLPLLIAGRSYPEEGYWHQRIEPFIDGVNVRYVGEADLARKIELYQNAKAVLFPTQYLEAFGLVMIESMACGTPVIGWDSGSVSEVLQDGETGFVVKSVKDMVKAIKNIDNISRKACRARAERYFSTEKMVSGYEKVYARVIEQAKKAQLKKR